MLHFFGSPCTNLEKHHNIWETLECCPFNSFSVNAWVLCLKIELDVKSIFFCALLNSGQVNAPLPSQSLHNCSIWLNMNHWWKSNLVHLESCMIFLRVLHSMNTSGLSITNNSTNLSIFLLDLFWTIFVIIRDYIRDKNISQYLKTLYFEIVKSHGARCISQTREKITVHEMDRCLLCEYGVIIM